MNVLTHDQHNIIQATIYRYGEDLRSIRESMAFMAFAPPEMWDEVWQRVADLMPELVTDVLITLGYDDKEFASDRRDRRD